MFSPYIGVISKTKDVSQNNKWFGAMDALHN
jgi:hypothetical protein